MNPSLHAHYVYVEDTEDCLFVGLADDQYDTDDYLMLQRAHEFDEQDQSLGMADIHIERNDQGCSGYGGIERFELLSDRVRVQFDDQGARNMEGIREMEITF